MIDDKNLEHTFSEELSEQEHLIKIINKQGFFRYTKDDISFSNVTPIDSEDYDFTTSDGVPYTKEEILKVNEQLLNKPNTQVTCTFKEGFKGVVFNTLKYHRVSLPVSLRLIYGVDVPVNYFGYSLKGVDNLASRDEQNKELVLDWLSKNMPFRKDSIESVQFDYALHKVTITPKSDSLIFTQDRLILLYGEGMMTDSEYHSTKWYEQEE